MSEDNFAAQDGGAKNENTNKTINSAASKKTDLLAMMIASILILILVGGSFAIATVTKTGGEYIDDSESDFTHKPIDEPNDDMYGYEYDDEDDEDDDDDEDDEQSEDDAAREEDVERIITAIVRYQSNNNGKTPLSSENGLVTFVRLYIDSKCSDGEKNSSATMYTYGDTCSENFQDPDGTEYKIRVDEIPEQLTVGGIWKGSYFDGTVTHELIMVGGAKCADKEAYIEKMSGDRFLAVLYAGDDSIICKDNS